LTCHVLYVPEPVNLNTTKLITPVNGL